jgi:hypothetical protein
MGRAEGKTLGSGLRYGQRKEVDLGLYCMRSEFGY